MKATKKCFKCKQEFRREELIDYAAPGTISMHSYCCNCLEEKHAQERFAAKVCQIFGIKTPGPRIYAERKRLRDRYGYTDDTIVDCLDYIKNVKKKKMVSESIYLVTPTIIEEMMAYKSALSNQIVRAIATEMHEYVTPIIEPTEKKKEKLNPDDWLDFD